MTLYMPPLYYLRLEMLHCRNVNVIEHSISHIAKAKALVEIIKRVPLQARKRVMELPTTMATKVVIVSDSRRE